MGFVGLGVAGLAAMVGLAVGESLGAVVVGHPVVGDSTGSAGLVGDPTVGICVKGVGSLVGTGQDVGGSVGSGVGLGLGKGVGLPGFVGDATVGACGRIVGCLVGAGP